MVEIVQKLRSEKLEDFQSAIKSEIEKIGIAKMVKANSRIAIAVGSRGIAHIAQCVSTVVEELKKYGASPFIVPAMGSHGGATPEGQVEVLRSLGVTEEVVKAPIVSSLEVEEIGRLPDNYPVYVSRNALNSDGIVLVNRVKPHTDFKDKIESGLMKIAVVGLGKQKGAETLHSYGVEGYHKYLPIVAKYIIEKLPVLFGLAIVEDAYHEISVVKAIPAKKIEEEERRLLEEAKRLMPKIPFKDIDVLIIDQVGKDISGAGIDPNVTGRFVIPSERPIDSPNIKMIVALDLTEKTEGHAAGIGFADLTTRRLFSKIDFEKTFVNSLTAGYLGILGSKTPIFLSSDKDAIETAVRSIYPPIDPKKSKIVRIRNTLNLEHMWISESLIEEVKPNEELNETIRLIGKTRDMMFDVLGNLVR